MKCWKSCRVSNLSGKKCWRNQRKAEVWLQLMGKQAGPKTYASGFTAVLCELNKQKTRGADGFQYNGDTVQVVIQKPNSLSQIWSLPHHPLPQPPTKTPTHNEYNSGSQKTLRCASPKHTSTGSAEHKTQCGRAGGS